MLEFLKNIDVVYLILGTNLFLSLVLLVMLIISMAQNRKWKKKYERFMTGRDAKGMEETILKIIEDYKKMRADNVDLKMKVDTFAHDIKSSYKKIGIVRYDAFKGMKGKLSFAICLLDDFNSGFVLNSMKGAEGNYTYMKEIIHGKAIVVLGEEENQALSEALACEKYE